MKRCLFALTLVLALASAASAVSISLVPDQAAYLPGDTVTLSVVVDPAGASATHVAGALGYDPSILLGGSVVETPLTSFGGTRQWAVFQPLCSQSTGECTAFSQIAFDGAIPGIPDQGAGFVISTLTFTAGALGSTNVEWTELDFFGLTDAPGATVNVVPEPATAALLALGLALAAKRVRSRAW